MTAPTPTPTPTPTPAAKPTPKGLQWPIFIVNLLALNMTVCGITVFLAVTNPVEIEPDYYNRALNWDETRTDLND